MWATSAAYKAAIRRSHTRTTRAVLRSGGTTLLTLTPQGGKVTIDARRDVRRTCSELTLVNGPGDDLIPSSAGSPLSPLTNNEVALYRGIILPSGVTEEVPLGVFGFESATMKDGSDGAQITLTGLADRSRIITRSRWRAPFAVQPGADLATAIGLALTTSWAACPAVLSSVTVAVTALVVFSEGADSDPWKDVCALAGSYGCELFFDPTGVPILRALPSPASSNIVATYQDGADAMVLDIERALSVAEGSYNGVIVSGESASATVPVRGEWWDNSDPTVPPTQPRPLFYASQMITTQGQAQATAQAMLPKYLGASENLAWSMVPDPSHDAWDLVQIVRPSIKANTQVLVDFAEIPLESTASQSMRGRARAAWGT